MVRALGMSVIVMVRDERRGLSREIALQNKCSGESFVLTVDRDVNGPANSLVS